LGAVLDEQEKPESDLDYSGDSTGIIKPEFTKMGSVGTAYSDINDLIFMKVSPYEYSISPFEWDVKKFGCRALTTARVSKCAECCEMI
jgi:hypothetical protein